MGGAGSGFGSGRCRLSNIAGTAAGLEDICIVAWETHGVASSERQARGVLGDSRQRLEGGAVSRVSWRCSGRLPQTLRKHRGCLVKRGQHWWKAVLGSSFFGGLQCVQVEVYGGLLGEGRSLRSLLREFTKERCDLGEGVWDLRCCDAAILLPWR